MKLRSFIYLHVMLALVLACSGSTAQVDSSQGQLEQALEKLNGVIGDAPSRFHHERAEVLFRLGRFAEAVRDYDSAARFGRPHDEDWCWERGLAQYYAGDFRGGGEQFERYHRVGSSDIENGLWRFLCIAEEEGIAKARETMLEYPRKERKPFPALLALYLEQGSAEAVLEEAKRGASPGRALTTNLFNAHYYLAKYYEIADRNDQALTHIHEALKHAIPHFMYACAEIDAKRIEARKNSNVAPETP